MYKKPNPKRILSHNSQTKQITNSSMAITTATVAPPLRPPSSSIHSTLHFPLTSSKFLLFIKLKPQLYKPSSISISCSLSDETITTTTATKVASADSSLAVKKRAADLSPELKGTSIFLVGVKSSIKTNLAKLLAESLRYYYFDSDSLVEEVAGGPSAAKSFKETDEKGFRDSETEVLKQLSSMGRLVVCAGDGAVQSSTNLALLRHGISLWIDVPLDMAAQGTNEDLGQLSESNSEALTQLVATYEEMKGGYATADAKISLQNLAVKLGYEELDSVTTEDMTLEVLKELERLTRAKKMMEDAARPF